MISSQMELLTGKTEGHQQIFNTALTWKTDVQRQH